MPDLDQEIAICRGLAHKAAFVVGFARSNTTIVVRIINTAPCALLLGEANLWVPRQIPRFRDWYNLMHSVANKAQISKSSYAPDFLPDRDHSYAEWLRAAAEHYDVVGEKVALAAQHFSLMSPDRLREYYEAHFFEAKYVFLFRDPVQTLLSTMRLLNDQSPETLRREMIAWLTYVQFWADFIRIFPKTLTIVGTIDTAAVESILGFLELSSPNAALLLDPEERREHMLAAEFAALRVHGSALSEIFAHIEHAAGEDPVYREAGQMRDLERNDTRGSATSAIRTKPRSLGQAWAKAEALKATLAFGALLESEAA